MAIVVSNGESLRRKGKGCSFLVRQMALAIKLSRLMERAPDLSCADLARMENLTRARITQIMDLTLLAPDIKREILRLQKRPQGRKNIKEWELRAVCRRPVWEDQRVLWEGISNRSKTASLSLLRQGLRLDRVH